ncbi:hypothetical protein N779_21025 [Vibrio coralliilyticus OCN008]|nr:hypothetical protein N779_21025 [Vibrio coralliilyticus OCN008]
MQYDFFAIKATLNEVLVEQVDGPNYIGLIITKLQFRVECRQFRLLDKSDANIS